MYPPSSVAGSNVGEYYYPPDSTGSSYYYNPDAVDSDQAYQYSQYPYPNGNDSTGGGESGYYEQYPLSGSQDYPGYADGTYEGQQYQYSSDYGGSYNQQQQYPAIGYEQPSATYNVDGVGDSDGGDNSALESSSYYADDANSSYSGISKPQWGDDASMGRSFEYENDTEAVRKRLTLSGTKKPRKSRKQHSVKIAQSNALDID